MTVEWSGYHGSWILIEESTISLPGIHMSLVCPQFWDQFLGDLEKDARMGQGTRRHFLNRMLWCSAGLSHGGLSTQAGLEGGHHR